MAKTEARKPHVAVYERAIQNPFGEPSEAIQLKDTSRICRWFNGGIQNDHIWRKKRRGWEPVKPDDVADVDQLGGYQTDATGTIVRGERGQEVLMSMPKDIFARIQQAKTALNLKNVGNSAGMRQEVVEAASRSLGDQAADFLHRAGPSGAVTDKYERIAVVEE
jgi:hypothetical protein